MKKLTLLLCVLVTSWSAFAQVTVVRAGRLIDPDSGTVLTDQQIMIVGNKFAAVGRELHIPGDAR